MGRYAPGSQLKVTIKFLELGQTIPAMIGYVLKQEDMQYADVYVLNVSDEELENGRIAHGAFRA